MGAPEPVRPLFRQKQIVSAIGYAGNRITPSRFSSLANFTVHHNNKKFITCFWIYIKLYFSQLFVSCMSNKLLSTGWSKSLHKQPSYIPTRCGGGHRHHQGRQHYRPKNICIKKCLSCHEHVAVFRVTSWKQPLMVYLPLKRTWEVGNQRLCVEGRREIQRRVRDKIDTFLCRYFSVCGVVSPDDGHGRHRNMWEYSLAVCADCWTKL